MNKDNKYTEHLQFVNESLNTIAVYLPGDLGPQDGEPGGFITVSQILNEIIVTFSSTEEVNLDNLVRITYKMKEIKSFHEKSKCDFVNILNS